MKRPSTSSFSTPIILLFLLQAAFVYPRIVIAQEARITEEQKLLKTYPYSDPNPMPILISNPKIYPYFTFEGYSKEGKEMPWKVVKLENEHIQVFVMPESGGKVWGAIEKSTGFEFIYRNEVMKFRDIAMRGPWTSGGIEFNFGIIGHSPSTASKVDYLMKENDDGSVSCWIGNMDLPSRTHWRIEIRVPKDKAFFETNTQWYNPTPFTQSYYNWMTGAAVAREDLEFFCPGYLYLEHSGEAKSWPFDEEGREISVYANNNFGPSKSYHVVGTYQNYFGGYYHDLEVGFGQWAPYEEMPGQKLWLWALSRSGGIWEDLLTDTDGQYIEFQAGRLFNQYSGGSHINPIREVGFPPGTTDRWNEVWFPFKNINGMVDASPYGVLNLQKTGNDISVGINPLQSINDSLIIFQDGKKIFSTYLSLDPMEIYRTEIESNLPDKLEVKVGEDKLYYTSKPDSLKIKRPFTSDSEFKLSEIEQLYEEALDAVNFRQFAEAENKLTQLIEKDPGHSEALLLVSELLIRKGNYKNALEHTSRVLRLNTYHPRANYLAGLAYRSMGDPVNALECLGWSARSMEFRSAAYSQMAEIYIQIRKYDQAKIYANKSLDFNAYQMTAMQALAIAERKTSRNSAAEEIISEMLEMDPLNHFARFERYLNKNSNTASREFMDLINNEFPEETCLEIALYYNSLNLTEEAIRVLTIGPDVVKNTLWLAYLYRKNHPEKSRELLEQTVNESIEFVFPFRPESLEMLVWANAQKESWKLKYYLALNMAGLGEKNEAMKYLTECQNEPDSWIFYTTRADLSGDLNEEDKLRDLKKAWQLDQETWRTWNRLIQYYEQNGQYDEALELAGKAYKTFPGNYTVEFQYSKALSNKEQYAKSINILKNINILPFEGSYESRIVYENAHLQLAIDYIEDKKYRKAIDILNNSLEWPENIGVGKPYDPDQRRQEFLLAYCYQHLKNEAESESMLRSVKDYTLKSTQYNNPNHILGLISMDKLGQQQEALNFMDKIKENPEVQDRVRKWIIAAYNERDNLTTDSQGMDNRRYPVSLLAEMIKIYN
jgi:predicted Zn-dependent protease